jgi:hypothetical protein
MTRRKKIDNFRDKCSSMLTPHFEILFKVTHALSTRYGITIPWEFWISGTFSIYALYMHFYGYSDMELIFFSSLAFLSLLFANSGLIFNFIKKVREAEPETTSFLIDIENKEINEIQKFLRENRGLSSKEIIAILQSKFNSYPAVHLSLLKYQRISGEILEYIITNNVDQNLNPEIVAYYIYVVRDDVSKNVVNQILDKYEEREVIKSLFISFPSHFHKISLLSFFVKWRNNIRDWFSYGAGDGVVALPAIILASVSAGIYIVPLLQKAYQTFDIISIIFGIINAIMGWFIIIGIIFIVIKLAILAILRIFKYVLYLCTPSAFVHK